MFCLCCACDVNERLSAPAIKFCLSFWITGSYAPLMLFLRMILHTMWSGKSLQLLYILSFGMFCLSAISMMFVNIILAVCMLVGMIVKLNFYL